MKTLKPRRYAATRSTGDKGVLETDHEFIGSKGHIGFDIIILAFFMLGLNGMTGVFLFTGVTGDIGSEDVIGVISMTGYGIVIMVMANLRVREVLAGTRRLVTQELIRGGGRTL